MEDFFERIGIEESLDEISILICSECEIEGYTSSKIIEVGYEDFNFILETSKQKYFVKIFNKDRTEEDCKNYIDRIELSNSININTPKLLKIGNIHIKGVTLKFIVQEYVSGKSFLDLKEIPGEAEIKEIIRQMAIIHRTKLDSGLIYDMWTTTNFVKEFDSKYKYLDNKYYEKFKDLRDKLEKVDLNKLPHGFVHGDIISSNVLKDDNGKLWIIDFAVSNYLPRIIDIVVTGCNLCQDINSKENTVRNLRLIIDEYEKYNKLTEYEKEMIPLFYDLGNAMGILQINYIKQNEEYSDEDKYWIELSEKGLEYFNQDLWKEVLNKNIQI